MGNAAYVYKSAESMGDWLKLGTFKQDPDTGAWLTDDVQVIRQLPRGYWRAYAGDIGNASGRGELREELTKIPDTFPTIERLLTRETIIPFAHLDAFSLEVERLLTYPTTRYMRLIALRLRRAIEVARNEKNPIEIS